MKMKPAITITTTILVSLLAAGLASAQSSKVAIRPTARAAASAKPAASAKAAAAPSKVAVVAPARSIAVQPAASSRVAKRREHHRGVGAVAVTVPNPTVATPQSDAPAAVEAAVNGAAGNGAGENAPSEQPVAPDGKYAANGRRDPFVSPVVSHTGGSGCSTGKKCLEIGAINLRGVVHSEGGFIAVVSNSLNKAYFLRENDPVFNGYVVKITGDSIVFQETVQDRLGKTFTREVVKKITTPAV